MDTLLIQESEERLLTLAEKPVENLTLIQHEKRVLAKLYPTSFAFDRFPNSYFLKREMRSHFVKHQTDRQYLGSVFDYRSVWPEEYRKKYCKRNEENVCVFFKPRGITLYLRYVNGVLKSAITDGNGLVGHDVTNNARALRCIPTRLTRNAIEGICDFDNNCTIDLVGVLSFEHYAFGSLETVKLDWNSTREKEYPTELDAVFQALIMENTKEVSTWDLNFHIYGMLINEKEPKWSQMHDILCTTAFFHGNEKSENVIITFKYVVPIHLAGEKIRQLSSTVRAKSRFIGVYPDGCIGKMLDVDLNECEGIVTVYAVEWNTLASQEIVPSLVISPFRMITRSVDKVQLDDATKLVINELAPGCEIRVKKYEYRSPSFVSTVTIPTSTRELPCTSCPVCGSTNLTDLRRKMYCGNLNCSSSLAVRLNFYVNTMDIKGFSSDVIERLVDCGVVNSIQSLYCMNLEDIISKTGMEETEALELIDIISNTAPISLEALVIAVTQCFTDEAEGIALYLKDPIKHVVTRIMIDKYAKWFDTIKELMKMLEIS